MSKVKVSITACIIDRVQGQGRGQDLDQGRGQGQPPHAVLQRRQKGQQMQPGIAALAHQKKPADLRRSPHARLFVFATGCVHQYRPTTAVKGDLAELHGMHGRWGLSWYETLLQTEPARSTSDGALLLLHDA